MSRVSCAISQRSPVGICRLVPCLLFLLPLVERPLVAATIYVQGACTLSQAIIAAGTDSAVGTCSAGSGHDTIVLTGDVLLSGAYSGDLGLPQIEGPLTIDGKGWTIGRAGGAPEFRIFQVNPSGDLILRKVMVENGRVTREAGQFLGGGCIYNFGTLKLVDSSVSGCQIVGDGYSALGGGIANAGALEVVTSTISLNGAWSDTDPAYGGGIYSGAGATATIRNSTVSGNYALSSAGTGFGGGLYQKSATTALVSNVTLSGNAADSAAALGAGSETTVEGSILGNSLISTNCSTVFTDGGGNQADDDSCGSIPDILSGLDPVLGDNGGPTMTHALLAGSSAIHGAGGCGLTTDQRGAPRGRSCDSGSFEYGGCPEVQLSDDTVMGPEVHRYCQIYAGPNYAVVGPSGALTLVGGRTVAFYDGVSVFVDGALTVELDSSLIP